jgi:hypothetical protein
MQYQDVKSIFDYIVRINHLPLSSPFCLSYLSVYILERLLNGADIRGCRPAAAPYQSRSSSIPLLDPLRKPFAFFPLATPASRLGVPHLARIRIHDQRLARQPPQHCQRRQHV